MLNAGKSGSRLWGFILFVLWAIVLFGYRAVVENDISSRQQTSFGTVGQCERRGRGHENWCHYSFVVGDDWYQGVSKTDPEVAFGQIVDVYYDSRNPKTNALEDFSKQSRENKHYVYAFLLVLAAVIAFKSLGSDIRPRQSKPANSLKRYLRIPSGIGNASRLVGSSRLNFREGRL